MVKKLFNKKLFSKRIFNKQWLAVFITVVFSTSVVSKEPAMRIITLSPHAVEMLYAIGVGDKIVGTVEWSDFPEEAKSIDIIGNYAGLNIEKIMAKKPDLIVAWKSGNRINDLQKLESLGLNVFYSKPSRIKGIGEELVELGKLTGVEANAQKVAQALNQRHMDIKNRYAEKTKVKTFYQLWHDPIRTVGPKSWINHLITDCNAENIFNDTDSDYPLVSVESVLLKNPQVIIIPGHSGLSDEKKNIWHQWDKIEAVKNKNIFQLNGDILHRFGPRAIDGLEKLCKSIDSAR